MPQKLLDAFRGLFLGKQYNHRVPNLGDQFSSLLYEDLYDYATSTGEASTFVKRIDNKSLVYNKGNKVSGKVSINGTRVRRGDGLLGQAVPGQPVITLEDYAVSRGPVANIRIGVEAKIISTAMIKQYDRVMCDVWRQNLNFKAVSPDAVTMLVVGINHSDEYRSYEGKEKFTDSSPIKEAHKVIKRIADEVISLKAYDEILILPFAVTNMPPYPFQWVSWAKTNEAYNAALLRMTNEYHKRFP